MVENKKTKRSEANIVYDELIAVDSLYQRPFWGKTKIYMNVVLTVVMRNLFDVTRLHFKCIQSVWTFLGITFGKFFQGKPLSFASSEI